MRKLKKMMYLLLIVLGVLIFGVLAYLQHPLFGENPKNEYLKRIQKSPNYKNGEFHNLEITPAMTEGVTVIDGLKEVLLGVDKDATPKELIPSSEINLHELGSSENVLIWFGHSSYFLQVDGVKMLIDPVFSNNASPVPGSAKAFKGADKISAKDIPLVDYLIFTHDHYDHLDYETVKEIKSKSIKVIAPLGVGAHLEYWGYETSKITEVDWNDTLKLKNDLILTATTARHGSGRKFKRNQTLWTSYVLKTASHKIFLGGDSGYGKHFKAIGEKYGPFDLAILENGQYNQQWKYTHMFPEEVLQATIDLKAKKMFPVHSGKFRLASHAWYEPLRELNRINKEKFELPIITPIIGQKVVLSDTNMKFENWYL